MLKSETDNLGPPLKGIGRPNCRSLVSPHSWPPDAPLLGWTFGRILQCHITEQTMHEDGAYVGSVFLSSFSMDRKLAYT